MKSTRNEKILFSFHFYKRCKIKRAFIFVNYQIFGEEKNVFGRLAVVVVVSWQVFNFVRSSDETVGGIGATTLILSSSYMKNKVEHFVINQSLATCQSSQWGQPEGHLFHSSHFLWFHVSGHSLTEFCFSICYKNGNTREFPPFYADILWYGQAKLGTSCHANFLLGG